MTMGRYRIKCNAFCYIMEYYIKNNTNRSLNLILEKRLHSMVWSPLAGGRIFKGEDEKSIRVRKALNKVKEELGAKDIDEVAYAFLLKHPSKIGSGNFERILSAKNSLDLNMTIDQWFEIFVASRGIDIP